MEKTRYYPVWIGAAVFAVYIISLFANLSEFSLVSSQVIERPWTIMTHVFLHGSWLHLFSNLGALLLFGLILEKNVGSRNFLIIFLASIVVSSIADVFFYHATIGASGAVFGIIGALAALRPRLLVWAFGVPMYMVVAAILWAALDLSGFFYPDNIAHAAHLFGMGFGLMAGLWLREPKPKAREQKEEVVSDEELNRWEDEWMKKH